MIFCLLIDVISFLCSAESQEIIDGELAARVFQLIQVTDTGSHIQVSWFGACDKVIFSFA